MDLDYEQDYDYGMAVNVTAFQKRWTHRLMQKYVFELAHLWSLSL